MALNGSGPISLAGSSAGQSIAVELNLGPTSQISLNDAAVRTLANVPSGAIIMPTNFYGKSNRVSRAATISANTANYTVNTAKAPSYVAGATDFTLTINSGVFVSSGSTGSYAMTVDTSWAAGDTVTIVNSGTIVGRGGNGGNGSGTANGAGAAGGSGGPALLVQRAITMNNLNRIAGGGGGGGGQGALNAFQKGNPSASGGGGGGGGIGGSSGGSGAPRSNLGGPPTFNGNGGGGGTLTGAGGGGRSNACNAGSFNIAGDGGGYGSAGTAAFVSTNTCNNNNGPMGGGGSGGVCIQGNSNITYTNTGTRNGTINA